MKRTRFAIALGSGIVSILVIAVLVFVQLGPANATPQTAAPQALSLLTDTPEEGFALAVTLSRKGVTTTQTDREVLHALRPDYAHNSDALIAVSQVIAIHYQTIAAANDYWR